MLPVVPHTALPLQRCLILSGSFQQLPSAAYIHGAEIQRYAGSVLDPDQRHLAAPGQGHILDVPLADGFFHLRRKHQIELIPFQRIDELILRPQLHRS